MTFYFINEYSDNIVHLLAFGINHKTAPLAVRERLVFAPEQIPQALTELSQLAAVNEAAILSTCHRTEVYSVAHDMKDLAPWLTKQQQFASVAWDQFAYCHRDQAAVQHLMRVASGLDSMVLGEQQILGQVKQALKIAEQSGTAGNLLRRLFQTTLAISKQIRHQTGLNKNPVSVAYAITHLGKQIFAQLSECKALLLGAGDMIELVATHLRGQQVQKLLIANRSQLRAEQLAQGLSAQAINLADIAAYLPQVDLVIAATASPLPLIGKGMVETALKLRKHRPMLMVDLAVPRNIEAETGQLEDVYLYHLDDLQNIIAQNLKSRQQAAEQAELAVELQAAHFMRKMQALQSVDTVRAFRQFVTQLRDQELANALTELRRGHLPEQVLQKMSHQLINKIMHIPTVQLHQAAYDGNLEFLWLMQKLFNLNSGSC